MDLMGREARHSPEVRERVANPSGVPDEIRSLYRGRRGGSPPSCLNNAGTGPSLWLPGPQIDPPCS
jgi:hypothetical protein